MKMAKMITALNVVALLLTHAQSLNDDMIEIKEDLSHTPDLTMDQTALGESRESRDESKVLGPKFWPHQDGLDEDSMYDDYEDSPNDDTRPKINNDETASLVQKAESTNKARRSPNKLGEKMGTGQDTVELPQSLQDFKQSCSSGSTIDATAWGEPQVCVAGADLFNCCPEMKKSVACLRGGFHAEVLATIATAGNALDADGQPLRLSVEAFRHVPTERNGGMGYMKVDKRSTAPDSEPADGTEHTGCRTESMYTAYPSSAPWLITANDRRRSCDQRGLFADQSFSSGDNGACFRSSGDTCGIVDTYDRPYLAGGIESSQYAAYQFNGNQYQCHREQNFPSAWFAAAAAVFRPASASEDEQNAQLADSTPDAGSDNDDPYFQPYYDFAEKYGIKGACSDFHFWGSPARPNMFAGYAGANAAPLKAVPGLNEEVRYEPYFKKPMLKSHFRGATFIKGLQFRVRSPEQIELHQVEDTGFGTCVTQVSWVALMCNGCDCTCTDGNKGVMFNDVHVKAISGAPTCFSRIDNVFRSYFSILRSLMLVEKTVCCDSNSFPGKRPQDLCDGQLFPVVARKKKKEAQRRELQEARQSRNEEVQGARKPPVRPQLGEKTGTGWTNCAAEGQTCTFDGTKNVRYGANGEWSQQEHTNSVGCTNGIFGDPIPGVAKTCEISAGSGSALQDRSAHHNLPDKVQLTCEHFVKVTSEALNNPLWTALDESDPTRSWINPDNLKLRWMAGKNALADRLVCGEHQYSDEARYAFASMSEVFFPPEITRLSNTEMEITGGGKIVDLAVYGFEQGGTYMQQTAEAKNPAGQSVSGTLDSLRLDGGAAFVSDTTTEFANSNQKILHYVSEFSRSNAAAGMDTTTPKWIPNLDGSMCYSDFNDGNWKALWAKNMPMYRPNYFSTTTTLCPGKFAGAISTSFVTDPSHSKCTGGKDVGSTQSGGNQWDAFYGLKNKVQCRRDEYGDTASCTSRLTLHVFECEACDCDQLVHVTIAHGLTADSVDTGACKPWFVLADAGVRTHIAKYRKELVEEKVNSCE